MAPLLAPNTRHSQPFLPFHLSTPLLLTLPCQQSLSLAVGVRPGQNNALCMWRMRVRRAHAQLLKVKGGREFRMLARFSNQPNTAVVLPFLE